MNDAATVRAILRTAYCRNADHLGSPILGARLLVTAPLLDRARGHREQIGLDDYAVVVLDAADGHPSLHDLLACTAKPPTQAVGPDDPAGLPLMMASSKPARHGRPQDDVPDVDDAHSNRRATGSATQPPDLDPTSRSRVRSPATRTLIGVSPTR